jgi:hypothetical protein
MGMPPMISLQDFDTLPPSNFNDEDIKESDITLPPPRPRNQFTSTSIQIAFLDSLPLRLEITRLVNNLRSDLSYDDTLRLGNELSTLCRRNTQLFKGFLASDSNVNPFHVKSLDTMVRRFIICLHRPFFAKAKSEPKYYYSRKICLDTSLAIIQCAPLNHNHQENDWLRLMTNGVGFIKSVLLYSITTVYLELINQIQEHQNEMAPLGPDASTSDQGSNRGVAFRPPQFDFLRNVIVTAKQHTATRIRNGEANLKGAVFIDCALARIDALVSGTDPGIAVLDAARKSVVESAVLMRQAYKDVWGVDIDVGLHPELDVEHGGVDVPAAGKTTDATGSRSRNESSSVEMGFEDMDWGALMQDDSMDFGFGFEGSPEGWIFGGLESNSSFGS